MSDAQKLADAAVARIVAQPVPQVSAADAATFEAAPRPTLMMQKLLAVHYHMTGRLDQALARSQTVFAAEPNAENAKNVALLLRRMKRTEDGIAFARANEALFDPIIYNDSMAMLHWDAGDIEAASAHGTRSLELKDAAAQPAPPIKPRTAPLDVERPKQNVIVFSLWGDDKRYLTGAYNNAIVARYLYPGWSCRFYVDRSVPDQALAGLMQQGSQVMLAPKEMPADKYGLFWRFLVEDDPNVALYLCRDADSVMNIKERAAVEDWLASGRAFHVMRDLPTHCELILAGMWGAHRGNIGDMRKRIEAHMNAQVKKLNHKTTDQEFLRQTIWPVVRQDVLVHDTYLDFGNPVRFRPEFALPQRLHIGQNDWVHHRPRKPA